MLSLKGSSSKFTTEQNYTNYLLLSYLIPFLFSHGLICRNIGCIGCIKNRRMYIVSVVYSIKELTR